MIWRELRITLKALAGGWLGLVWFILILALALTMESK